MLRSQGWRTSGSRGQPALRGGRRLHDRPGPPGAGPDPPLQCHRRRRARPRPHGGPRQDAHRVRRPARGLVAGHRAVAARDRADALLTLKAAGDMDQGCEGRHHPEIAAIKLAAPWPPVSSTARSRCTAVGISDVRAGLAKYTGASAMRRVRRTGRGAPALARRAPSQARGRAGVWSEPRRTGSRGLAVISIRPTSTGTSTSAAARILELAHGQLGQRAVVWAPLSSRLRKWNPSSRAAYISRPRQRRALVLGQVVERATRLPLRRTLAGDPGVAPPEVEERSVSAVSAPPRPARVDHLAQRVRVELGGARPSNCCW